MRNERYDIIIIGTGAGGATMAHALADSGASARARARRLRSPRRGKLESRSGMEAPALSGSRAMDRSKRRGVSTVRTTASGGTPSSGAASCIACAVRTFRRWNTSTASRRRGRSIMRRWNRADQAERLCTSRPARRGSERGSAEPVSIRCGSACARHGQDRRTLRLLGLNPSSLPLGLLRLGQEGGCVLCSTCNSFPCKVHAKSDAEVVCIHEPSGVPP